MKGFHCCFLCAIVLSVSNVAYTQSLNPLQFGLEDATNGTERYEVLLRCHQTAQEKGATINYKGIDTIQIEIPKNNIPIPLTDNVDFYGVTIVVENKQKNLPLFEMKDDMISIEVDGYGVDNGNFKRYDKLKEGISLLIVEDGNPWCIRQGYDTKVFRKDVIVVKSGTALNKPIISYSSPQSNPIVRFRKVDNTKKTIKNLNFVRAPESTFITYCFRIENQYNIRLNNILISTPLVTSIYGDAAIQLENCANVSLNDITILGTYSQEDKFGYGLSLENVYNLKVNNLYARSKWGIFGSNCLQKISLKKCDLNRFDIHCYGRDLKAVRCKFSGLYNQVSSVFGTVLFNKCEFENFIPLLIESSYNAYTAFDLVFKNCMFHLDDKHNYIMTLFGVPEVNNERPELKRKSLPNITMKDCTVSLSEGLESWELVKTGGVYYKDKFDYISSIDIKGLKTLGNKEVVFKLFSESIKTTDSINVKIR